MFHVMFQYCPECALKNIVFDGRKAHCPDCGFVYFHNVATATGCVIYNGERVLMLVRGREPALGKLDLPGGFVDPGEGVFEGLCRELKEELGWEPPIKPENSPASEVFTLFASFANVYPYKGITYNTCDLFFYVLAPDLSESDLCLEKDEITSARFVRLSEINPDDLAFDSTRKAIKAFKEL